MKRYLLVLLVLISASSEVVGTLSGTMRPLQDLDILPDGSAAIPCVNNIREAYNALAANQSSRAVEPNVNVLFGMVSLLDELESALLPLFPPFAPLNPSAKRDIRLILESLLSKITDFLEQPFLMRNLGVKSKMEGVFTGVTTGITNLDRFVKMMNPRQVVMGDEAYQRIPSDFSLTVKSYLGRIFVIKNDRVVDSASGMIVPKIMDTQAVTYDQIITCGHSAIPDDRDPSLEFYFMRAEALEARTGLPALGEIATTLDLTAERKNTVGNAEFAKYLKKKCLMEQNVVRRIVRFQAFGRDISILAHHSPRYHTYQDNGYGYLDRTFEFSSRLVDVDMATEMPSKDHKYYALGYPVVTYFQTKDEPEIIRQMCFAPLTVAWRDVSGDVFTVPVPLTLDVDGKIIHGAPTMPGMSGGPIVIFDESSGAKRIKILGVVTAGTMDNNYACKFW